MSARCSNRPDRCPDPVNLSASMDSCSRRRCVTGDADDVLLTQFDGDEVNEEQLVGILDSVGKFELKVIIRTN